MTVDAALKYIVSMGVVAPAQPAPARRPVEPRCNNVSSPGPRCGALIKPNESKHHVHAYQYWVS
jgi:uncharacterized membrane protein